MTRRSSEGAQQWDPQQYASAASFVPELGRPVLDLLGPVQNERVLDLGCGDGVLTRELLEAGATVVGVDASPAMVAAAAARGIAAAVSDGHDLAVRGPFDAVFSNAALHWMRRPDDVIASVHRVLKPGGRFVGELGGHGCVAAVSVALVAALERRGVDGWAQSPWYFPTVDDYGRRLERGGFAVESIALIPRPTALPGTMEDWLVTFAAAFLAPLPASEHGSVRAEVADTLRPALCDEQGRWTADYVRLRFAARKSA